MPPVLKSLQRGAARKSAMPSRSASRGRRVAIVTSRTFGAAASGGGHRSAKSRERPSSDLPSPRSILVVVGLWIAPAPDRNPTSAAPSEREGGCGCRSPRSSPPTGAALYGTIGTVATFVLFCIMTVFALNWGTTALGYTKGPNFLPLQLIGVTASSA